MVSDEDKNYCTISLQNTIYLLQFKTVKLKNVLLCSTWMDSHATVNFIMIEACIQIPAIIISALMQNVDKVDY